MLPSDDKVLLKAELEDLSLALLEEPKNYHGWQYRQWLIRRFEAWQDELAFIEDMLAKDPYNNSAWNHRFYVLTCNTALFDADHELACIKLAIEMSAKFDVVNQSAVGYAHALMCMSQSDQWRDSLVKTLQATSIAHHAAFVKIFNIGDK